MIIHLNGLKESIADDLTVSDLIEWAREGDPDLIVEVNGRYVFPNNYEKYKIQSNDRVEFINPNLGG